MEVDQILVDSLRYAKSNWSKVALLGVIYIPIFILGFFPNITQIFTDNLIIYYAVLGVTSLISLIISFFYGGYLFRVIKASLAGINELPSFDEFTEMFIDGIKVFVVSLVYGIIYGIIAAIVFGIVALIMIFAGVFTSGMMMSSYSSAYYASSNPSMIIGILMSMWLMILPLIIGILVMIPVTVIFRIVLPISIANMALNGNIGAAFSISDIQERIKNIRWSKAILWLLGVMFISIIGALVSIALGLLFIGLIIVPLLIIPYLSIFEYRSIALLFEEGK